MRNEKNRFELGTEVRLEKAGTKKGGENQKILASRGGVGCYRAKPSATRHACPARQECRSTRVWPQCGKETYHQRARLARFVALRLAPVNRNVGATTVNCVNDNRGACAQVLRGLAGLSRISRTSRPSVVGLYGFCRYLLFASGASTGVKSWE